MHQYDPGGLPPFPPDQDDPRRVKSKYDCFGFQSDAQLPVLSSLLPMVGLQAHTEALY